MEKKKKGKGIVIVIILLALVAGGYFVYDNLFSGQSVQGNIEAVEVKEVGSFNDSVGCVGDDNVYKVFDIIDDKDAFYYKVENGEGKVIIKQVNEEDFNSVGSLKSSNVSKVASKSLKTFLNTKYDKLPKNVYASNPTNGKTIFGDLYFSMADGEEEKRLTAAIGMEFKKLFDTYELVISCNDITIDKMAVYDTEDTIPIDDVGVDSKLIDYAVIASANVFTEQSKKGVSKVSCFAEEGKSKEIKFMLFCTSIDYFKDLGLNSIFIEN